MKGPLIDIVALLVIILTTSLGVRADDTIREWKNLPPEQRSDIYNRARNFHVRGTVKDTFRDDIDADYVYLALDHEGENFYVPVRIGNTQLAEFDKLVGADITFTAQAVVVPATGRKSGGRFFTGPLFLVHDFKSIHVVRPSSANPFDVPEIEDLSGLRPDEIGQLGRRRIVGRVTACWNGHSLLVDTISNRTIRVELAEPNLPSCGEAVEVAGFVGTDVFRLNLNRAIWRPSDSPVPAANVPETVRIHELCRDARGNRQFQFNYHGKTIRIRGLVRSLPAPDDVNGLIVLEEDGQTIAVNTSTCPTARHNLEIGATLEVTGVCVMDVDGWRPNDIFPPIRGLLLVAQEADDLRVIAHPPWLTPTRAAAILIFLLMALAGILIWNTMLRKLAERRGRALLERELESAQAESRLQERTRLAVELHDSIAQTLTGVAMELETAGLLSDTASDPLRRHLDIATRALDSCRDDLRNCLWDLRNDALDAPTMCEAIRKTLLPHCKDIHPTIRFNVPRACFTDKAMHAILCVIRELVLNAIRHGHATDVRIAGSIDNDEVAFSVQDNGCGFDQATMPGVAEGHFGIQGIRERIQQLGGSFTCVSEPGKGTKVTVRLKPNHVEQETIQ